MNILINLYALHTVFWRNLIEESCHLHRVNNHKNRYKIIRKLL